MNRVVTIVLPGILVLPIAAWIVGVGTLVWLGLFVGHQVRRLTGLAR